MVSSLGVIKVGPSTFRGQDGETTKRRKASLQASRRGTTSSKLKLLLRVDCSIDDDIAGHEFPIVSDQPHFTISPALNPC
jgi:hypothetical protein